MAEQAPDKSELPGGLKSIGQRILNAALANKGLVLAMVFAAFCEALFTKGVYVLIEPLLNTIVSGGEVTEPPAEAPVVDPGTPEPGGVLGWIESAQADLGALKERLGEGFRELVPQLTELVGLEFGPDERVQQVVVACALIAALFGCVGAIAIYFATLLTRYFATKVVVDLRNELAGHLVHLPLRYFGKKKMGELLSNITNDTQVLARSFTLIADHILIDPFMILMNLAILVIALPEGLPVFLIGVPLMALPLVRMGKRVRHRSGRSLAAMGDSTESMNQMLSGIKTVKSFGLEGERLDEFARNNQEFLYRTRRMLQTKARSQSFLFVGYQVGFAALLLGVGYVLSEGKEFGGVVLGLIAFATTYTHVKRLARIWNLLMESLGAMDRIDSILNEDLDFLFREQGEPVPRLRGRVEMQGVSFSYGEETVLQDVSFVAEPGQTIAFVGASGAGKSTAMDLLARFYDPDQGRVLVDGKDLKGLRLSDYRRHVALVGQQPFLFNTTVYQNILYGRPDASREEVEAAARTAQIHDFIQTLPDGYESLVGERGSNLSGGQMQRITIARAVLRDPAILFLDEATSALDSESEEAVQKALDELRQGRTSFAIAHRLSTIRNADQILVMERGRVIERGTHDSLVAAGGHYCRLVELQTQPTR